MTIARDTPAIEEAQRLRYRVFGEGLGARLASGDRGIDEDEFDSHCDHLIVRDVVSGAAIGTYRILAPESATAMGGYCSEREFDLSRLRPLRGRMAEVGRTCVDPAYRSGVVMLLMWSTLAKYAIVNGYDHLIGCASVGLGDGGHGAASIFRRIAAEGLGPEEYRVFPRCPLPLDRHEPGEPAPVPPLVKGYLSLGAWVCGEPAWDRDFNCADLPVLLAIDRLDARFARHFLDQAA
ncbi:MAG TPA: GNAT family N-acyltransferase [Usitatibacteraceae bacterium]|nr:GNAT family N-acyltransferase [Usitatibacteraceae bacterium]